MDHRERKYEEESKAASLPRHRAPSHPLDARSRSEDQVDAAPSSSSSSFTTTSMGPLGGALMAGESSAHADPLRGGGGFVDGLGASGGGGGGGGVDFDDPLRALGGGDGSSSSPGQLSRDERASEVLKGASGGSSRAKDMLAGGGEDAEVVAEWETRKQSIHHRFSGQGTIQVSMTFDIMSTRERGAKGLQSRLEELDDPAKGERAETIRISQQEYVARLRQLNDDITHAWLASDRISALKLAIQAAKLLRDTSVPAFYPILFVLVADIMDTIGRLVYDRIRHKAEKEDGGKHVATLPPGFTCDDVRAEAKITCRNWFCKIASVQELVPRLYMELAILRCYHFLQRGPPVAQLRRLVGMCRGVGDTLVASYLRAYLAHKGLSLCPPGEKDYLIGQLSDFMPQYGLFLHPESAARNAYLASARIPRQDYLNLMDPAVDWQLHCCVRKAEVPVLKRVMALGGRSPPPPFLRGVLQALPPSVVAANAEHIVALIAACTSHAAVTDATAVAAAAAAQPSSENASPNAAADGAAADRAGRGKASKAAAAAAAVSKEHMVAQADCYRILGEKLADFPLHSEIRLGVLREVWAVVRKYSDLSPYLRCADTWVEYVLTHFGHQEINALLKVGASRRHVTAF